MPTYHVLHDTTYEYGSAVSLSQQQLHLQARELPWQRCLFGEIVCDPVPGWTKSGLDAFGNPMNWLNFDVPHESLHVRSEMTIEVLSHNVRADLSQSLPWEAVQERLSYAARGLRHDDFLATSVLFESPYVRIKREIGAYAAPCFPPGRPLLEGVQALMEKMHNEFEFDTEATTVATPVIEVLRRRRGVCQDFAHMMLACLRAMGLSARYVSGYLLTHPPPGKPRMVGADASHAWIAVYSPSREGESSADWVEFDPTNNLLPDTEHITLAWGRDFGDVSPLRGVILGGGTHEPKVEVTVTPLEEGAVPKPLAKEA